MSRNPKETLFTIPDIKFFYHDGKGLGLESFACIKNEKKKGFSDVKMSATRIYPSALQQINADVE